MQVSRLLFVEPPKDYWFLMGEYLPPPTILLVLAAYVERELPDMEIQVLDCQAERKGWDEVKRRIETFSPQVVATSGFTCNAYACAKVAETSKVVDPSIVTVVGGQHFSFTAEESLRSFPEIDFIVKGEGEVTLVELLRTLQDDGDLGQVAGLVLRRNDEIFHADPRPMIENLDTLPYPAYHLVEQHLGTYHFTMMAGRKRYLILEGSRGCTHKCTFCSQWKHWNGTWRTKSPKRIADEMEHLHERFSGQFLWLTDDNFDYKRRGEELWQELRTRGFAQDVEWFFQARTDDIARNPETVARLRTVGNNWILVGVESNSPSVLKAFRKGVQVSDASEAVRILRENDIFAQCMFVIGSRADGEESIASLRRFSLELDTDLSIYTVLTPYPGTEVHKVASRNGWIEDTNYAHYDMAHAIMPTESMSRRAVQQSLFECYRAYYGSIPRNVRGIFSRNRIKRRAYRHMAGKGVLRSLRDLL